jgi:hypothetical protein
MKRRKELTDKFLEDGERHKRDCGLSLSALSTLARALRTDATDFFASSTLSIDRFA